MAASLTPVEIPANSSVDLYAATGITVGVKLIIQNIGNQQLRISENDAEPTASIGYNKINPTQFLQSAITPIGVWATNTNKGPSQLQVEEA